MIKEVIVVEGKDDTVAIRRAVDADTIETGGSAIDAQTIEAIRLAQKRRGVIIFTDPDHAGEKIRKQIAEAVPGCKHAFIDRRLAVAKNGKGIGIEYASPEAIRQALDRVKTDHPDMPPLIEWRELIEAGLVGHPRAASRRWKMGMLLGIGYANGKQFYKRCGMFQITREEFQQALRQTLAEEDDA